MTMNIDLERIKDATKLEMLSIKHNINCVVNYIYDNTFEVIENGEYKQLNHERIKEKIKKLENEP